jgi:hypothetical protein
MGEGPDDVDGGFLREKGKISGQELLYSDIRSA